MIKTPFRIAGLEEMKNIQIRSCFQIRRTLGFSCHYYLAFKIANKVYFQIFFIINYSDMDGELSACPKPSVRAPSSHFPHDGRCAALPGVCKVNFQLHDLPPETRHHFGPSFRPLFKAYPAAGVVCV